MAIARKNAEIAQNAGTSRTPVVEINEVYFKTVILVRAIHVISSNAVVCFVIFVKILRKCMLIMNRVEFFVEYTWAIKQ